VKSIDYSDRAISLRLRQASQLRKLCLSLGKAKQADKPTTPAIPEQRDQQA
jgi:hypothetical protein